MTLLVLRKHLRVPCFAGLSRDFLIGVLTGKVLIWLRPRKVFSHRLPEFFI
jgi:hypothetical protein